MRDLFTIKVPLSTDSQKETVKHWLKQMRAEDQNFRDVPKANFGQNYVRLTVMTAMALMPWTDTRVSGDLDAYRFKKDVLKAIRNNEAKAISPWHKTGLSEAVAIIEGTPVGEYMNGPAPRLSTKKAAGKSLE